MLRLTTLTLLAACVLLAGSVALQAAPAAQPVPARPDAPLAWGLDSSPNPGTARNDLRGVWAAGANDVWAVGFAAGASGIEQTLILHNTGSGWTVAPSPNGAGGDNYL